MSEQPTLYIASPTLPLYEWAEHLLHRADFPTYNPARNAGLTPTARFESDMHMLANHVNAVVTLPGYSQCAATLGTVCIGRALGLPIYVLIDHPDPKVAFALQNVDEYEEESNEWGDESEDKSEPEEMDKIEPEEPMGSNHRKGGVYDLATECVNDDAENRPQTARDVFEKVFGRAPTDTDDKPKATDSPASPWPLVQSILRDAVVWEIKKALRQ
jgi:hypothetical protein